MTSPPPILPLHQRQLDAAVRLGFLPAGEVPRVVERFGAAEGRGPLHDVAEAIGEAAGLTRGQVEQIRRAAKDAYLRAPSSPDGRFATPAGAPPALPLPSPQAPSRARRALFGAICLATGSALTLIVGHGEEAPPRLAIRPTSPERPGPEPEAPASPSSAPAPVASADPAEATAPPEQAGAPAPSPSRRPREREVRPPRDPAAGSVPEEVRPPVQVLRRPGRLQGWLASLSDDELARLLEDRTRYEDYLRIVASDLSRSPAGNWLLSPEAYAFLQEMDRRARRIRER